MFQGQSTRRNCLRGYFAAAAALCLTVGAASAQTTLWQESFDNASPGSSYTGGVVVQSNGGYNNSRCVLANYNIVRGTNGNGSNRMVRNITFNNTVSASTTLNYRIKFDNDFDTTLGGKFMGIGPKNFVTGGRNTRTDGWSARVVMDGRVPHLYIYDQDKNAEFGRKIAPADRTPLSKDQWHSISLYVRLNTAGDRSDGLVELHVNGVKRAEFVNARLRGVTTAETRATTMLFHTFLGSTGTGTYLGTQHVRFDDFYVRTGRTIR